MPAQFPQGSFVARTAPSVVASKDDALSNNYTVLLSIEHSPASPGSGGVTGTVPLDVQSTLVFGRLLPLPA